VQGLVPEPQEGVLSWWEGPGGVLEGRKAHTGKVIIRQRHGSSMSDGGCFRMCLDPLNPDTDGDGVPDGVEVRDKSDDNHDGSYEWPDEVGFNPDEATNPLNPDTDGDGRNDGIDTYPNDPLR